MIPLRYLLLAGVSLLAANVPALAVKINNQSQSSAIRANSSEPIERGGIVDFVDMESKTMSVDGTIYTLPQSPLELYAVTGAGLGNVYELTRGTKIQFKTSQYNFSNKNQVNEIILIGQLNPPSKPQPLKNTPGKNKPGNF